MQHQTITRTLGVGVLTWARGERISDRYGAVYLIQSGHNSLVAESSPSLVDAEAVAPFEGRQGELIAIVKEARDSTHMGDIFRGVSPRKPEVGQIIVLGNGRLFSEPAPEGGCQVGLRPADGRANDWLNIRALYDAHEQTVELIFHPKG